MNDITRQEIKYIASSDVINELRLRLAMYFNEDNYYYQRIHNVYFDNANDEIIEKSLEKPIFKEKLRLRVYEMASGFCPYAFLEMKKKFYKIVYKRRLPLTFENAEGILDGSFCINDIGDSQIAKEILDFVKKTECFPKVYLSYERYSLRSKEDSDLRITFDTNIQSRFTDLSFNKDTTDKILMNSAQYIMEIKANGALPLYLTKILTELKCYPASFSKYGKVYEQHFNEIAKGGNPLCLTA